MFNVHNAISTPDETEERFQKFMKHLNLNLTKEELKSARNYFNHGFDNSAHLQSLISGQQKFNFDEE
jgi:hypothetical protein